MKNYKLQEELNIIGALLNQDKEFLETAMHGTSRIVFDVGEANNNLRNALGLPKYIKNNVVIKLAIGEAGYCQNRAEVEAFERYGNDYPLAQIYAAGRFINVMEFVTPVDGAFSDYPDEADRDSIFLSINDLSYDKFTYEDTCEVNWEKVNNYCQYYSLDYSYNDVNKVCDVIDAIYNLFETGDAWQVGENECGDLVAYDYGVPYDIGEDYVISSRYDDAIAYSGDTLALYLKALCDSIKIMMVAAKKDTTRKSLIKAERKTVYRLKKDEMCPWWAK